MVDVDVDLDRAARLSQVCSVFRARICRHLISPFFRTTKLGERSPGLLHFWKLFTPAHFMPRGSKLSAKEVAERLEASRSTITRLCREGKFRNAEKIVTRFGDHWEIPESDLTDVEIKVGRPKKED